MAINWSFLHGFLGEVSDFDMIVSEIKKTRPNDTFSSYSLREKVGKKPSFEKMDFSEFQKPGKNIYVGYSMGGRLLSQYAFGSNSNQNFFDNSSRLFLVSSGMGLENKEEISKRITWENEIIGKMKSMEFADFYDFWSSYGIFAGGKKRTNLPDWSQEEMLQIFDGFRLSKQNYLRDELSNETNCHIFLGSLDSKYINMYDGFSNVSLVEGSGHRVPIDEPLGLAQKMLDLVAGE